VSTPGRSSLASGCERPSVSSRRAPRPPTSGWSPSGSARRRRDRRAPARHRGAHLVGRQAAKQRGKTKPQVLRFSSSSPAPTRSLTLAEPISRPPPATPRARKRAESSRQTADRPRTAPQEPICRPRASPRTRSANPNPRKFRPLPSPDPLAFMRRPQQHSGARVPTLLLPWPSERDRLASAGC
jgi:hypothetical protein